MKFLITHIYLLLSLYIYHIFQLFLCILMLNNQLMINFYFIIAEYTKWKKDN